MKWINLKGNIISNDVILCSSLKLNTAHSQWNLTFSPFFTFMFAHLYSYGDDGSLAELVAGRGKIDDIYLSLYVNVERSTWKGLHSGTTRKDIYYLVKVVAVLRGCGGRCSRRVRSSDSYHRHSYVVCACIGRVHIAPSYIVKSGFNWEENGGRRRWQRRVFHSGYFYF